MKKLSRRDFLKASASVLATLGITKVTGCGSGTGAQGPELNPVPMTSTRLLGKTGFNVHLFSLGGQAALEISGQQTKSEQIINRALALGVNYIDTSAAYGGGLSERNIGQVMKTHRDLVFLATKSLKRSYDGAMRDLQQSLKNLQTDYVDLWQIHNIRTQSDLDAIFSSNGAIKAFEQAKTAGMTRFIGVTGHYNPAILAKAMTSHEFDTVLMALNAADIHYRSFIKEALPVAVEHDMGIIAMKIPARGRLFRQDGVTTMEQALGYTLTHPISTAIIGCSNVSDVEKNVELANNFKPFSDNEMTHLENLTASYYREGAWFKYEW